MGDVPGVAVVCEADPAAAVSRWREALAGEAPVSVIDPAWPSALRQRAARALAAAASAGRLAPRDLVLFTSGSSGSPRAVHRSVDSWAASAEPFSAWSGVRSGSVVAVPGPLAGTLYSFAAWHAFTVGAEVVPGPPAALPTHRLAKQVEVVTCGPALVPEVLAYVEAGELPRVRTLVVAGDAVTDALWRRAHAAKVRLVEYYGAAELSFVGIHDSPGPLQPFPNVEVEIRDGVLWSRSPYVMKDYLTLEDGAGQGAAGNGEGRGRTTASGSPVQVGPWQRDTDGWSSVGDIAAPVAIGSASGADACGSPTSEPAAGSPASQNAAFVVRGRAGAAVITGGHTVVVEEVERFLREVPGVADVAVTGVPHPRLGQRVVAVVTPAAECDHPRLRTLLREAVRTLPAASRPRAWVFAPVPRSESGKVRREQLARTALEATRPTTRGEEADHDRHHSRHHDDRQHDGRQHDRPGG